jgi:hypothetical protein
LVEKEGRMSVKKKGYWDFIKANIFSLLTVIVGAIAVILNGLKVLPPDIVGPMTLMLVILLATSQLIDQSRKLEHIEDSIQDGFTNTISAVGGVRVIPLPEPEVGLSYLAQRVRDAKHQLDLASLTFSVSRDNSGANEWEKSIEKVLLANRVRFRYVCIFSDKARINRVRKHLLNAKISKFFVGYFAHEKVNVPMPNFLIVDDEEVIAIYPYCYGEPEVWLSIKHPDVIKTFTGYFRRLWEDSTKITAKDIDGGLLERITSSNAEFEPSKTAVVP